MIETKIYVVLNDSETLEQKYEVDRYLNILKEVFRIYHVPFSYTTAQGGYVHEDGRFTEETAIVISMIDAKPETVSEIAKDLCVFFHQESVLITEGPVRSYYVNEHL